MICLSYFPKLDCLDTSHHRKMNINLSISELDNCLNESDTYYKPNIPLVRDLHSACVYNTDFIPIQPVTDVNI